MVDSSDEPEEFKRKLSTTRREVLERGDESGMNIKVVLTKSDLGGNIESAIETVNSMGMTNPLVVSSHDGQGMDELAESIMYSLYGPKTTLIVSEGEESERSAEGLC